MIASFGDKATEALFHGGPRREYRHLPPDIIPAALRKLDMINAASILDDLRSPPGNRLHPLDRDLAGFHGIRINDQWRVIFRWEGSDASDVQVTDYH